MERGGGWGGWLALRGVEINDEGCVTTHIWAKKRLFGLIWRQTSANLNHLKLPQCTILN